MECYVLSGVESPELITEVDRLWSRLETDPELRQDAEEAGTDVSRLTGQRREDLIEFRTPRHGIGGPELLDAAAISATSALHVIAWDLWKRVLLPRIAQRFGKNAVKRVDAGTAAQAKSASPRKKTAAPSGKKKGEARPAARRKRAKSGGGEPAPRR